MFKWRLYYDDGSTFSDGDGAPHDSPPWGVVAVSQPDAPNGSRELLGNGDYYLYRKDIGLWHEVATDGLPDHLAHFGHLMSCVRPGRWMPNRVEWVKIVERMRAEARDA